jgi:hypothetical protein
MRRIQFILVIFLCAIQVQAAELSKKCLAVLENISKASTPREALVHFVDAFNENLSNQQLTDQELVHLLETTKTTIRAVAKEGVDPYIDELMARLTLALRPRDPSEPQLLEREKAIDTLMMNNRNVYFIKLGKSVSKHISHEQARSEFLTIGNPAQALAHLVLNHPVTSNRKLEKYLEARGGPTGFEHEFKMSVEALKTEMKNSAEDEQYRSAVLFADKVFRILFPTEGKYKEWSHHPWIIPYFFYKFIEPNAEKAKIAATAIENKIKVDQLGMLEDFDNHLSDILAIHPEVKDLIATLALENQNANEVRRGTLDFQKILDHYRVEEKAELLYTESIHKAFKKPEDAEAFFASAVLQTTLSLLIRGADHLAAETFKVFEYKATDQLASDRRKAELWAALEEVARDREVQRNIVRMASSLEMIFIANLTRSNSTMDRYGMQIPLMNFRPQQLEGARLLMQYSTTYNDPKPNFLEIGYGNPSLLAALKVGNFRYGNVVGVDVLPVPKVSDTELQGVKLFQGNVPADKKTAEEIRKLGPYSGIVAIDVFKWGQTMGAKFEPGVPMLDYLKWVYSLLKDGEPLVILNDTETPPNFSKQEAEAAGFHIVRWNEPRDLDELELTMVGGTAPDRGKLRATVLRRGELSWNQLGLKVVDKQGETVSEKPAAEVNASLETHLQDRVEKILENLPGDEPTVKEAVSIVQAIRSQKNSSSKTIQLLEVIKMTNELPNELKAFAAYALRSIYGLDAALVGVAPNGSVVEFEKTSESADQTSAKYDEDKIRQLRVKDRAIRLAKAMENYHADPKSADAIQAVNFILREGDYDGTFAVSELDIRKSLPPGIFNPENSWAAISSALHTLQHTDKNDVEKYTKAIDDLKERISAEENQQPPSRFRVDILEVLRNSEDVPASVRVRAEVVLRKILGQDPKVKFGIVKGQLNVWPDHIQPKDVRQPDLDTQAARDRVQRFRALVAGTP